MATVRVRELAGKTVIDGAGNAIGDVEDLLIDTETWQTVGIQVKLLREAADLVGASRGVFHSAVIDVPISAVHAAGQAVVLKVALTELRDTTRDAAAP